MKEGGLLTIIDPGSDKPLAEIKTVKCCHCGGQFQFGPGYTKDRGWCFKCNGPICGAKCIDCVPEEAMLEIMEGTRNPTAVSDGGNFNGSLWIPN